MNYLDLPLPRGEGAGVGGGERETYLVVCIHPFLGAKTPKKSELDLRSGSCFPKRGGIVNN